ncbi:peptide/nickel transport system permease protein [Aminobacter niigataensis]|uniref:Peptide/nickel transport system permease protein n=1 Tax=Aminobacter niigataensis TaxID=83265 RepID=A0ABR6L1G1_9HYPH|nr:ABC transporter permease [Aminobacter niigataensis]MBB4650615.1 peptide/nickel transport system permease protein [Aminobacter niigataensis]
MGTYAARRLISLLPIVFGISIVVFLIMRMLPGDVAAMILMGGDEEGNSGASREAIEALRVQLGLDVPLWQQYFSWIGGLLQLDAGNSLWSGRPVFDEILQRLPLTIELALLALVISLTVAVPLGILSALKQDTWIDYVFRGVSIGGLALPSFWLGTLVILGLTVWFNWTPPLGYVSFTQDPWINLQQLFWPALVIGYSNAAIISRMTRSAMLEVLREDYVRTAWAKGLNLRSILTVHALRNALLPVITLAAIELGNLLSGTVVMETIFTLPGIGRYLVDAIFHRDYPVVQTIIVLMGILFVVLNLLTDLLYGVLDPRIRYE